MGSFAPQTPDDSVGDPLERLWVREGMADPELNKWLHDHLMERAIWASRNKVPFAWCVQEEYNKIWEWYKVNNRIPYTDMVVAENGYTNLIMFGVAWVVGEEG